MKKYINDILEMYEGYNTEYHKLGVSAVRSVMGIKDDQKPIEKLESFIRVLNDIGRDIQKEEERKMSKRRRSVKRLKGL